MARQTKDQIADELYGCDFEECYGASKAVVTRKFNAQASSPARGANAVEATIGRVGVNGTKTCLLNEGATVQDLLNQAEYGFDTKKESITEKTTGERVSLSDVVENGAVYVISVEIKSA
jgi:hypothetical protein